MDAPWRIQLLGALRAERDGQTVTRFRTQMTAALLARLALFLRRSHSREELVDLMWPDADLDAGRNRLRVAISSLRRQLEPPGVPPGSVLVTDRNFVSLNPAALRSDVADFEMALAQAARASGPAAERDALRRGFELYQGELLPGFYDDWIQEERERLSALFETLCIRLQELPSFPTFPGVEGQAEGESPDRAFREVSTHRIGIPMQFTRFFGRERECAELTALLQDSQKRLLTLTGPGGSGKTRLAVQIAQSRTEFVCFVPLADLTDADSLPSAISGALRLPQTHHSPLDLVVEALADKRSPLLILDNFEHLVERGASVVLSLLTRLPALTCLVTSRRRLKLPAEQEYPVSPLALPISWETPEQVAQAASAQLFVDRAQAARPDFQLTRGNAAAVAALCRKLEGIPLALELVAARSLALTPAQMIDRLGENFALLSTSHRASEKRHRSLWAAMAWSYDLIPPPLQRFFARLSVFRGGCTVEAAQEICAETQALEFLTQLRERSLAIVEEGPSGLRFRLLEVLREFAGEQLSSDERRQLAHHHADYFGTLAQDGASGMVSADQGDWLNRLESDRENLYAALAWRQGEPDGADEMLRLAGALWRFWAVRGYYATGRLWLGRALARPGGAAASRAAAANGAGNLARKQGDYDAANALFTESLTLRRAEGDKTGVASCLGNLGLVATHQGDYARARELHEQSLALRREMGDQRAITFALNCLAVTVHYQQDYAFARALNEETLALATALGDDNSRIMSLANLGLIAQEEGDFAASARMQGEALRLCLELQDQDGVTNCLEGFAQLAARQGQTRRAVLLYAGADAARHKLNVPPPPQDAELIQGAISTLKQALSPEDFTRAWAEGLAMTSLQSAAYALEDASA